MATVNVSVAGRKDKSSPMKKQPVAKVKVKNEKEEEKTGWRAGAEFLEVAARSRHRGKKKTK